MTVTVNDLLASPPEQLTDFKRDHWQRPLIVPAGGGKPKPYTRASSAAKTVDDTYNLEKWARRNVAFGMANDGSLIARVLAVGSTPDQWGKADKDTVNGVVEDAERVAKSYKAADIGTAVHRLTEHLDHGRPVNAGPYQPDLDAYQAALFEAGVYINPEWIECRLVCDELEMAGTADRIVELVPGEMLAEHIDCVPGLIADIKTGESIDYGGLNWGAQLAVYANSQLYDPATDTRLPTPAINRDRGLIIHLPAGQGRCDLYLVNLQAGYEAARLANQIRATRKAAKQWIEPVTSAAPVPTRDEDVLATLEASVVGPVVPVDVPSTVQGLRARLNNVLDAGVPVVWPENVPRFKHGGPFTWAQVLKVEQAVLDAEKAAGLPFPDTGKLPEDPTAVPVERELVPPVGLSTAPLLDPPLDRNLLDELNRLHNRLPEDLQRATYDDVAAAGVPTDRRQWRDSHRDILTTILAAAMDEHEERIARVGSVLMEWDDDAIVVALFRAIVHVEIDELLQVKVGQLTALQVDALTALVEALDVGAIAITWTADGTPSVASNAATEPALLFAYENKTTVVSAARAMAAEHGRSVPRSTAAAASDPVLAALLLTNQPAKEPTQSP